MRPCYVIVPPQIHEEPYLHFATSGVLDDEMAQRLLAWLEVEAPWRLAEESFYEQYEFDWAEAQIPDGLRPLFGAPALRSLREQLEGCFGSRLDGWLTVWSHKLLPGQRIDLHNDSCPGFETHRFVLLLNHGLAEGSGGHFLVFGSEDTSDVRRRLPPLHNSGVGIALSDHSFHAVTEVTGGERYSLIYSFWRAPPQTQAERSQGQHVGGEPINRSPGKFYSGVCEAAGANLTPVQRGE